VEWVEVQGKSVEVAVEAALTELGIPNREAADVEIIQEPSRGFLGMGGQTAIVRVKAKPKSSGRRRGRSRSRGKGGSKGGDSSNRNGGRGQSGGGQKSSAQKSSAQKSSGRDGRGDRNRQRSKPSGDDRRESQGRRQQPPQKSKKPQPRQEPKPRKEDVTVDIAEQAQVIEAFLEGLLDAFGLEGTVSVRHEDDIIYAEVTGEQTEALVGQKGAILQAVLELCRTIVQRRTQAGARIRLDVAGYAERRREALGIYAARLAEQVLENGGESMLEPMHAADRKVVHDAILEIDGVRSFSEGEDPHRSVVVAPAGDDD